MNILNIYLSFNFIFITLVETSHQEKSSVPKNTRKRRAIKDILEEQSFANNKKQVKNNDSVVSLKSGEEELLTGQNLKQSEKDKLVAGIFF